MADATKTPLVARQALWTYRGLTDERAEKDFYIALEAEVASELARRFQNRARVRVGREVRLQVGDYTLQARLTNLEPLLATTTDKETVFIAQYRGHEKDETQDVSNFIAEVIRYPDEHFLAIYHSLVGIDTIKRDLVRKLNLLLQPGFLDAWLTHHYGEQRPEALAQVLRDRYPLIILEGEVGSGKTALARSVGHHVALNLKTEVALYVVNAQVRGGGHVGELTQNIARTFNEAERCVEREQIPVIIFIDEADALAQSRGGNQTHHEDDAGVNALIQRIDHLRGQPIAVIFATNLAHSLDAAIVRRAIATYHFDRPTDEQRAEVFRRLLTNTPLKQEDIERLVFLTQPRPLPGFSTPVHRYTYSDISQRIIPQAVEDAIYQQTAIGMEQLIAACKRVQPTPEMQNHEQP
ncbi:MAG TPA: ATP-binding protein [Ktedonobacteraceae bacterium]|nr:ATP-binding protein [Ktedonobacteraceae bacterium]